MIPTGNVTFLFSDIEESDLLTEKFSNKLPQVLELHNTIFKKAIESNNGFIFKKSGGAFCASFQKTSDAMNSAIELQKKFADEKSENFEIKIKTGIHKGESHWLGDDYSGYLTLSRVHRIMSEAYGGQILISNDVYEILKDKIDNEISFKDLGEKRLKDIIKPIRLYQIITSGLQKDFPELKTSEAHPNNLPVQLTSFIGREKEILKIKELFSKTHLLTLIGPGGTGKTRLSLQIGADIIDDFTNGVWVVEFAALNDPLLLINEVASALNLKEAGNNSLIEVLIDYLKGKEILMILDNCEHVIDECAKLSQKLMKSCSKLKILASSREALRISGETIYKVPTLSMPGLKESVTPESLNQYEAVRLFIDRALSVKKDFAVNNKNASAVAQLCYRLDGIPFAIELAAARVNVLTVEKILESINDRFNVLTRGSRTALPRQKTLRALIDWSYDLLAEEEKLLLQRLSVFSGDWSLEAVEKICSDELLNENEIFDSLSNLLNKSLVNSTEKNGENRYYMLETIRHYGIEKLIDKIKFQEKHFLYYLKFYEGVQDINGAEKINLFRSIKEEQENLRSAINWAAANDPESALKLVNQIGEGWEFNGNLSEGFETYEKLFLSDTKFNDEVFGTALLNAGYIASQIGKYDIAEKYLTQSIGIFKKINNNAKLGDSLNNLGNFYFIKDEINLAKKYHEDALSLGREINDKVTISTSLINIGAIDSFFGNYENSYKKYNEGLKIIRELNDKLSIARVLSLLAFISSQTGNLEEAQKLYEESLPILKEFGDHINISITLLHMGDLSRSLKKFNEAELFYEECLTMSKQFGYTNIYIHILIKLGEISIVNKNIHEAGELFAESIKMCNKESDKHKLALAFKGMSMHYFEIGNFIKSAKAFGISESLFKNVGVDTKENTKFNSLLDNLKLKLGEEKFFHHLNEGKIMSVDEAIDYINNQ